jgi:hypothetical protein
VGPNSRRRHECVSNPPWELWWLDSELSIGPGKAEFENCGNILGNCLIERHVELRQGRQVGLQAKACPPKDKGVFTAISIPPDPQCSVFLVPRSHHSRYLVRRWCCSRCLQGARPSSTGTKCHCAQQVLLTLFCTSPCLIVDRTGRIQGSDRLAHHDSQRSNRQRACPPLLFGGSASA